MTRHEFAESLLKNPLMLGKALGYKDLTELHGDWMKRMLTGEGDMTLQAHRGSFKTTCLCIVIAEVMMLQPKKNIIFLRKTDTDVHEVVKNVKRILETEFVKDAFYEVAKTHLVLERSNASELTLATYAAPRGAAQLLGIGIGGSITGKHADIVITDDIVNLKDRKSRADRETTKAAYMELQNVKNRGGRIINTGTPWHKEDAFSLMPNIERHDCYETGLISKEQLEALRQSMTASLFAANYELKHIADEELLFSNPVTGGDPAEVEQGECHVDAAYGGEDYTAFTICRKHDGHYYVFGKLWHKHVDDVQDEIIKLRQAFNAGRIACETNADKGYLAKSFRAKGERTAPYPEKMNKFVKITSYLKAEWTKVIFVVGTDEEYINQICDYNEDAEHDDAPDSLASMIRLLWPKKEQKYTPIFM